jgi:hypothetical protein
MQRGIAWQRQLPAQRWLLVQDTALLPCVSMQHARNLGGTNRRKWWLLPARATMACR